LEKGNTFNLNEVIGFYIEDVYPINFIVLENNSEVKRQQNKNIKYQKTNDH